MDLPDGATVGDLVERLLREDLSRDGMSSAQGPDLPDGRGPGQSVIFVNGRNIGSLAGVKTRLGEGDKVLFVIPAAGG
ncbi:MAG: molybdopterin synthase sulfur carrier subunit [Bacillota bacterium]|jgi:molybdopterin converting factor small subunit|nr:MAG: molybdopterin synthase sulfur carrier subunit [Bacillota bacterium]